MYKDKVYLNPLIENSLSLEEEFNQFLNCFILFLFENFQANSIFYILDLVVTSEISKLDNTNISYIKKLKAEYNSFFQNVKSRLNILYKSVMPEDFKPLSSTDKKQYPDIVNKYLDYFFQKKNKEKPFIENKF